METISLFLWWEPKEPMNKFEMRQNKEGNYGIRKKIKKENVGFYGSHRAAACEL